MKEAHKGGENMILQGSDLSEGDTVTVDSMTGYSVTSELVEEVKPSVQEGDTFEIRSIRHAVRGNQITVTLSSDDSYPIVGYTYPNNEEVDISRSSMADKRLLLR